MMNGQQNQTPGRHSSRWRFSTVMLGLGYVLFIGFGVLSAVLAFDSSRPHEARSSAVRIMVCVVCGIWASSLD